MDINKLKNKITDFLELEFLVDIDRAEMAAKYIVNEIIKKNG